MRARGLRGLRDSTLRCSRQQCRRPLHLRLPRAVRVEPSSSRTEDASVETAARTATALSKAEAQPLQLTPKRGVYVEDPQGFKDVPASNVIPSLDWLLNSRDLITLSYAVIIGAVVAGSVFTFDISIQVFHDLPELIGGPGTRASPACTVGLAVAGGAVVAWLSALGFAPPLKVVSKAVDSVKDDEKSVSLPKDYGQVLRKALASVVTLGSGASLGPEAPSVELGANTAGVMIPKTLSRRRQRMLLAAGAAAGVSAAFDAPVAGALFAVEFVLKSSRLGLDRLSTATVFVSTSVAAGVVGFLRTGGQEMGLSGAKSHLIGRIPYYSNQPSLLHDVAYFSALGVACAVAAVALYEGVRLSEILLRPLPRRYSAPLAGGMCALIALAYPQVQFGYTNLEEVFRDSTTAPLGTLVPLLIAKIAATSVCVGGGLVGGLFAPSLFLGALVGDILGHYFASGDAGASTFAVVGGAAVLGASCRAPLTAIALMVEITRDTGLLVPLLAAIGTASLVTDYAEGAFSSWVEEKLVELYLKERALFWSLGLKTEPKQEPETYDAVEVAMSVTTNLYVRRTLPLVQARETMAASGVKAAVVVDEDLQPVGVAYMADVEEEIVRRRTATEQYQMFGADGENPVSWPAQAPHQKDQKL